MAYLRYINQKCDMPRGCHNSLILTCTHKCCILLSHCQKQFPSSHVLLHKVLWKRSLKWRTFWTPVSNVNWILLGWRIKDEIVQTARRPGLRTAELCCIQSTTRKNYESGRNISSLSNLLCRMTVLAILSSGTTYLPTLNVPGQLFRYLVMSAPSLSSSSPLCGDAHPRDILR